MGPRALSIRCHFAGARPGAEQAAAEIIVIAYESVDDRFQWQKQTPP
jgi:hypothetical protein